MRMELGVNDEGHVVEVSLVADPGQLGEPIPPEPIAPAALGNRPAPRRYLYPMGGVGGPPAANIHHLDRAQQAIRSVLPEGDYEFLPWSTNEERVGDIAVGWTPMPNEATPGWTALAIAGHPRLFQYRTVTDVGDSWPRPVLCVRLKGTGGG